MAIAGWLADTSALARIADSADAAEWAARIERDAASGRPRPPAPERVRRATRRAPLSKLPLVYLMPAIEDRAMEVQPSLADLGHHRAPSVPDLLVAAAAELTDLVVLHADKEFDLMARSNARTAWEPA